MLTRTLLAAAVALAALTGCSGQSCDGLPELQAEREQRRAAYARLVASGGSPEETTRADDELHAFERGVFDLEQECSGR